MSARGFAVPRYRFRATFRHRWPAYLTIVVMVALIGGLGLGSLAAARRTQSSFSVLLAATNPSDLEVSIYSGGTGGPNVGYSASLTRKIARLPGVRHVAAGFELTGAPLTRDGSPRIRVTGLAYPVASVNGLFFTQDRMVVEPGPPGVPAACRRDRHCPHHRQAARVARRPGGPLRVLLGSRSRACRVSARRPCDRLCG